MAIKPVLSKEEVKAIEEGYLQPAATLLLHRPAGATGRCGIIVDWLP